MPSKRHPAATEPEATRRGTSPAQPGVRARAKRAGAPAPAETHAVPAKKAARAKVAVKAAPAPTTEPATDGKAARKAAKSSSKLVRDSFTMPEADFAVIALLKGRALGARRAAKKSELLRAGLRALAKLDAKALVAALDQLKPVKAGRPKKGH